MKRVAIASMILPLMVACSQVDASAPHNNAHANHTGDESLTENPLRALRATPVKAVALPYVCRASWMIGGASSEYGGRGATEGEARAAARIACTNANLGDGNRSICRGSPEGDRWNCSTGE